MCSANDPAAYVDALDRFYSIVMTLADNRTLQDTHASLMGPVRRLRRIAMARGGRMRASFEQTVKIKDAISTGDKCVQDLMREAIARRVRSGDGSIEGNGWLNISRNAWRIRGFPYGSPLRALFFR